MHIQPQDIFTGLPFDLKDTSSLEDWAAKYPYFSIPHILLSLGEKHEGHTHHYFNTNPVLIHYLTKQVDTLNKVRETTLERNIETTEGSIDSILEPISTQDYFAGSNISISDALPSNEELVDMQVSPSDPAIIPADKALLIQMKFEEWLQHISLKKRQEREDLAEQEALKLKWRQQKLADAIQEENDDIPEEVFKMAVDSIEREESLISESLANVYALQGKKEQAISMYKKLILQNPQKKAYFADKIQELNKDIQ